MHEAEHLSQDAVRIMEAPPLRDSQKEIGHFAPAVIATKVAQTFQQIVGIGVPKIALGAPARARENLIQCTGGIMK